MPLFTSDSLEVFLEGTTGANNEILTSTGIDGKISSESGLTFDGTTLNMTAEHPKLIFNTNDANGDPSIYFKNSAGAVVANFRCSVTGNTLNEFSFSAGENESDLVIDANSNIGIGDAAPGTRLQITTTTPYITLKNSTAENTAGGCEGRILFEDHADVALAQIEGSHSGTSDDTKGKFIISTHTGSALTAALTIDDSQDITLAGGLTLGTDLAITHGGTGESTAQAAIDALTAVSGASAGEVLTKDGSGNAAWVANPLGTVTSVGTAGTVNGVTLTGTVTTSGNLTLGGTLAINNGDWSGTDLSVANGGTGVSTFTDGGILLGSGTGAITAMAELADGEMIVGDGSTDPVAESGATLRTSIGVSRAECFIVACSDETTALTTGTAKATFRMPYAFTLTAVRASVTTAPAGSVLTVDINEGGSTILTTKLTIDASEKTSTSAATAAVIAGAGPALADDAEMTIDIDGVGSGTAGAGLKISLIGYQTTPT